MADDPPLDEVIKEFDVVLAKPSSRSLYVFQYPIRSKQLGYEDAAYKGCRVKPHQQKVELELALNTASAHYSRSKGEQIAINADSAAGPSSAKHFPSQRMDKQLLTSTVASIPTGQYVIGVIDDDELRVMPLNAVLQLRPSFNYLDKAAPTEKEKDASAPMDDDTSHDEEEVVSIKFARQETDEAKARRMATYDYLQKKQEEEPWINVRFHGKGDHHSLEERDFVCDAGMSNQPSSMGNMATISLSNYVERLLPKAAVVENTKPNMPANVVSLADLKSMSLSNQVKTLLMNAKVLRFAQLLSLLPKGSDVSNVLKYVQHVAVLVQGCWVVRSDILYPEGTRSANGDILAETLCFARDYVLYKFNQSRFLLRKDITQVVKLPSDDLKEILEQVSKLRPRNGWEFNCEFDNDFVRQHSDIVQRQALVWEQTRQALATAFKVTLAEPGKDDSAVAGSNTQQSPTRRRRKSSTCQTNNNRAMSVDESELAVDGSEAAVNSGPEPASAVRKSPQKPPRRRSSKQRENGATTDEEDVKVTGHKAAKVKADSNFKVMVEPMAVDNGNGAGSLPAGDVEMADLELELDKFVSGKLASNFVLTLSELRMQLSVFRVQCPEGHALHSFVSDEQLTRCANKVGGTELHASYMSEATFVWPRVGDSHDNVRAVVIDCLRSAPRLRITTLKDKLDAASRPSDNELRKILKDYCVSKSGFWQIKCVLADG